MIDTMKKALGVAATLYAARASAEPTSFCTGNNQKICFQWAVPEAAASSGSGNVYFQIRAPTEYSWVGLGIGQAMAGADIFVMYQDGNGNVTVSTRSGRGHVMPEYNEQSGVQLLQGSGVSNGEMIANVRCSSCSNLSLGSSNQWIAAWLRGDSLASSNPREQISVHDDNSQFRVDFAQARINSDQNPFVSSGGNGGGNGGDTKPNSPGTGSGSGNGSGVTVGGGDNTDTLFRAHGIVMTVVFAAAYPIGALLMPIVRKWYIHASWQTLAFLGMWAGFALGYVASSRRGIFFEQPHSRLGTVVCAMLGIQPVLGWLHHQHYLKHQRRGIFSYVHIFYGQTLMLLGIINGGLGLRLAKSSNGFIIAYSVVAGVCSLLYIGASVMRQMRPARQPAPHRPSKASNGSNE